MANASWAHEELSAAAFIGEALAPFFLQDPKLGSAGPSFQAIADLDAREAAAEWPFVSADEALWCLQSMQGGLASDAGDALMWEYRRLFVGPGHKAAPPWGSVYTDHDRVIFGLTTLELRQWMRERGIERQGDTKDPEDHIGLMLELMTWLARNRPADLDEHLRLHLLTWAPHFLTEMEQETTHSFYQGLARLTRLSLEGIRDARGLRVEEPRFYQ